MARLSTHVLDTASGRPAAALRLCLLRLDDGAGEIVVGRHVTNQDGRTDAPLLAAGTMAAAATACSSRWETTSRPAASDLPDPPFLDVVTIDFGIADASGDYHVPLLVSPWSYSTYRGS